MECTHDTPRIMTSLRFRVWYLRIFRGLRVDVIRKHPVCGALGLVIYAKTWILVPF